MAEPIKQPEALRLADELATRCVTRWVHSTGEMPRADGYAMDVECVKAAAELRRQHAEVEGLRARVAELEAAARLALNSMELLVSNFICDATHHAKADQHQWADCPIEVRFASAKGKLRAALKETK